MINCDAYLCPLAASKKKKKKTQPNIANDVGEGLAAPSTATGGVTSTIKCMPNPRLCVQEQHFRIEAHLRRQVIYQHPLYTCLHSLLYTFYRGVQVSTGQEHTGT